MCSYGVILWEMFAKKQFFGEITFSYQVEDMIQAGKRPDIPEGCPSDYADLIKDCWAQEPDDRPHFSEVVKRLHAMIIKRAADATEFSPLAPYLCFSCSYFFLDYHRRANEIMELHTAPAYRKATYWNRQGRASVRGGECKATFTLSDVTCMTRAGRFVLCGMADGSLTVINPQVRKVLRQFRAHSKVTSMIWLRKGSERLDKKYVTTN